MFLLLVTVFFSSTILALAYFKVKKIFRVRNRNENDKKKRIPGPSGYPLVGCGLEFVFPNSVG